MQTTQQTFDTNTENRPQTTPTSNENGDGDLQLSYKSNAGNAIVIRTYTNHAEFVREVDEELMYNYIEERWESVHRFTHDYDLSEDGETLAGDGSNWRGTGRNWREWFTARHYERLRIRFPNDDIPDSVRDVDDHNPVDRPE